MPITPTPKIWMNGELVDWDQAQIHVLTHTLHYGMGVFEGIRAYQRRDGRSTEGSADPAGDCLVPAADRVADRRADRSRDHGDQGHERPARRGEGGAEAADADSKAEREADPVPLPHRARSVDPVLRLTV